jgi:CIC family chloride channel protein
MDETEMSPEPSAAFGIVRLTLLALVAGAAAGAVGAAFRFALGAADRCRELHLPEAHAAPVPGLLIAVAACGAATAVAAWLVRRFQPYAGGSGIPQVEAMLRGGLPPAPLLLAPIKFIGGVLAIGAGLALGR